MAGDRRRIVSEEHLVRLMIAAPGKGGFVDAERARGILRQEVRLGRIERVGDGYRLTSDFASRMAFWSGD